MFYTYISRFFKNNVLTSKICLGNIIHIQLLILLFSFSNLHAQYLDKGKLNGKIKYLKQLNFKCEIVDDDLIVVDSSYHDTNEEYEYFNNERGQITRRNILGGYIRSKFYEYDSLNRVSRMEIINSSDSLSGYQEFKYDSDDRTIYWHFENGKYTTTNTYEYFEDGKLHILYSERPHSNYFSKNVNSYDAERRRIKTETFDKENTLISIITQDYFVGNHVKTKTITTVRTGKKRSTEYYFKNGFSVNKQNGLIKTFNENGDKISFKNTNSQKHEETLYKYKYDKIGNWFEKIEYRWTGDIILYTREIEYY